MSLPGIGPLPLYGFQRPAMLLFGLVPLALLAIYVLVQARRRRRLHRYTDAAVAQSPWRHLPIAASLLCLALLTIALATPTHDMRIPRNRAVIMLVIDMSQSMRATDVEPNRLKAAEQAASQFAEQLIRDGRENTQFAGEAAQFDADFFNLSPREASAMDPRQRWALELTWELLEDAFVVPETLRGQPVSVYLGAMTDDYAALTLRDLADNLDHHTFTGISRGMIANRISYAFGLQIGRASCRERV